MRTTCRSLFSPSAIWGPRVKLSVLIRDPYPLGHLPGSPLLLEISYLPEYEAHGSGQSASKPQESASLTAWELNIQVCRTQLWSDSGKQTQALMLWSKHCTNWAISPTSLLAFVHTQSSLIHYGPKPDLEFSVFLKLGLLVCVPVPEFKCLFPF